MRLDQRPMAATASIGRNYDVPPSAFITGGKTIGDIVAMFGLNVFLTVNAIVILLAILFHLAGMAAS